MSLVQWVQALGGIVLFVASATPAGGVNATAQRARSATASAERPAPLGSLVDVGGYRIHLYCAGQGAPTVVITGAGGSFDWGLVQPEVAKDTRICSFDRSGTAWSDPGPPDSCSLRVRELHAALGNAGITGPLVLVGHSLGALVSRLYAATYPADVAGLVIVDHATNFPALNASLPAQPVVTGAPLVQGARVPLGEATFRKLPPREFALHEWAGSLAGVADARRTTPALFDACAAAVESRTAGQSHPLLAKPVAVLHTNPGDAGSSGGNSRYVQLQESLAALSTNSVTIQAEEAATSS